MIEFHIILSTIALMIMMIAAIQAVALALQDYLVRHDINFTLLKLLPSLETTEKWLFRTIVLGFIVLSMVFISSLIYFHPLFIAPLWQKVMLTLIAWGVFAGLLSGRWYWGWRGRVAIRWTLTGVLLLLIIYCGTGLLLNATY